MTFRTVVSLLTLALISWATLPAQAQHGHDRDRGHHHHRASPRYDHAAPYRAYGGRNYYRPKPGHGHSSHRHGHR